MTYEIQSRDIVAIIFVVCYFIATFLGIELPSEAGDILAVIIGFYFATTVKMLTNARK